MYIDTTNAASGRIVLNAAHADTASIAERLNSNAGDKNHPVYFESGIPQACDVIYNHINTDLVQVGSIQLYESVDGDAITVGPSTVIQTGMGGAYSDNIVSFMGSSNQLVSGSDTSFIGHAGIEDGSVTAMIPGVIGFAQRDTDNNSIEFGTILTPEGLQGNAATATLADKAKALDVNKIGSATVPVYFDGGVPTACTSLSLNTSGNAATATKLKTARNIGLTDADGTNTGTGASFDGNAAITLKLPANIKANITGNLTGKADAADKLNSDAGSSSKPVYFSGGVPVACSTLELDTTGTAKWSKGGRYTVNFTFLTPQECYNLAAADNYDIIYGYMEMESGTMAAAPDDYLIVPCETHVHKWFDCLFVYQTIKYYNYSVTSSDSTSIDGYTEYWRTNYSVSKWTDWQIGTAPMVQAGDANTPIYINGDGVPTACTSLDLNATTATTAQKLAVDAGDINTPVYFSAGVPTPCTSLDLNTTGSAAKWTTPRAFKVTDSDGTNSGASVNVDGSAAVTLKLPSTIKATLAGKATSAGNADAAEKLNSNAGSTTLPVYFSGGVPVATSESLAVNITKNAATATKLAAAKAFAITDADGTNKGTGFNFDGSAGGTFKLPANIKANITGNISGTAAKADALTVNGGDSNTPVYFAAGVPTPCTGLDLDTSGNAATATKWKDARDFCISDSTGTNTGTVTSVNGAANVTIKLPATIKATLSGNASSADIAGKLDANGGSTNVPVYFDAGVPTPCTSLSLNTTGSAAKWTTPVSFTITDGTNTSTGVDVDGSGNVSLKLPTTIKATLSGNASSATTATTASKLDANGGSATVPVYFEAGVPTPCTSLSLNTTGNAATATNVAWSGVTSKPSYYDAKAIKSISRSGTTFTATHLDGTTSTFDQQDNNSDTKVTQTVTTENANYPLLLAPSGQTATTTTTSYFDSGVTLNPNTNTIAANISGNAATATTASSCSGNAATATVASSCSGNAATATTAASCSGNAATATKLAAAQTIKLTGDVTGSASFTGNSACTITATVADNSHNHNYAGSSSAGGPASSSNWLNANSTLQYGVSGLNYFDISGTAGSAANANQTPTSDWYHVIRMNHANTNGYYIDIASCFHSNDMYMKRVASGTSNGWKHIWVEGNSVTSAVWNDYAECRESDCYEAGYVLSENGDDTLSKSNERLAPFAGVSSDTWGFSQGETEKAKTHIAVAGRVLVYPYQDRNNYKPGDCVCAAPGGTVDIMTREEIREWPDRIVGTVSCVPEYEEWGGGEGADRDPVKVNGRIWIKVK